MRRAKGGESLLLELIHDLLVGHHLHLVFLLARDALLRSVHSLFLFLGYCRVVGVAEGGCIAVIVSGGSTLAFLYCVGSPEATSNTCDSNHISVV